MTTYAQKIADMREEKHTLAILRLRARVTGWTEISGGVWEADFNFGPASRVWTKYDGTDGIGVETSYPPVVGIYQDLTAGKLYWAWGSSPGPDDESFAEIRGTVPGLTVEYELYISDKTFVGPRNPMLSSSAPVEWLGVLARTPITTHGARDALYGFNPMVSSSLRVSNQDGWLMPHLHGSTFHLGTILVYVAAGADVEKAMIRGHVKQIFLGFMGRPALDSDGGVDIECSDFLAFLNRRASPAARFSVSEFPDVDPEAVRPGEEWFIRRVRGMVENFRPVNIDYDASPSTTVNRDFATHEGTGVKGGWGASVDDTNPGNSATRTYLLTTPKCNVGDSLIIMKGGSSRYTFVTGVNRALGYIDHGSIAGSFNPGDFVTRYYIGWIKVRDSDGNWWNLFAGKHFTRINKGLLGNNPDWLGFRLIDDWEADVGFPETFNPAIHDIVCRVYGTDDLDTYADSSNVGAVTDDGGVNSRSDSLLYWLLRQAGVAKSLIDKGSFTSVPTNHSLGLVIPPNRSDTRAPTFKELIDLVLQSMLWKLGYVDSAGLIGIGIVETGPFVSSADYEIDSSELRDFSFEHDYNDLKNRVELSFMQKEMVRLGDTETMDLLVPDGQRIAAAENHLSRDLHLAEDVFQLEILHFVRSEAARIAARYAYALGDRRAYYSAAMGPSYLESVNLGASYQIKRQELPGFSKAAEVIRERQTMLIEVQKSASGVAITLEDQKGIQDHSGDWS